MPKKRRKKRRNQKRKPITSKWQRRRRKIDGKNRMVWVRKVKGKEQVRRRLAHID